MAEAIDIMAMRYDAQGEPLDAAPIVVCSLPLDQRNPRVAWNGTDWIVVFTSRRLAQFSTSTGIYAVRVAADGVVLDPSPLLIDDDDFVEELDPSVTSDGVAWIVSWHDTDDATGDRMRKLARIDGSGAVVTTRTLVHATTNLFPLRGRMAYGGGSIARFVAQLGSTGPDGTLSIIVDLTDVPESPPVAVVAGEVWNFQCWHRDTGGTSNFSDAISITFE